MAQQRGVLGMKVATEGRRTGTRERHLFFTLPLMPPALSLSDRVLLHLCERLFVDCDGLAGEQQLALDAKREEGAIWHVCRYVLPHLHAAAGASAVSCYASVCVQKCTVLMRNCRCGVCTNRTA